MQDGGNFMASYAEFLKRVSQFESDMRQQGHITIRVTIDRAEILDWCRARGCQINAKARTEYAAWKALHYQGNR